MGIEVTDEAVEVLTRSLELSGVDPTSGGGVRLRSARGLGGGFEVQVELADSPLEGEEVVEVGHVRIFVDPAVMKVIPNPVVAVEPQHETVVVLPGAPT